MKSKKISAFLLCMTLCAGLTLEPITVVKAEPENEVSTEESEAIQGGAHIDENGKLTTGTQQNAIDNEVDVDEDIEEELAELIPTEVETISISTPNDLMKLAKDCRLDTWSANKYVKLENDILLAGMDFVTIPSFSGTFDGQGHVISGYLVATEESNVGLFAYLTETAIVKNVNVLGNVTPTGKSRVIGSIAGHNSGTVTNCTFKGIVSGSDYVGGIVGINELKGVITDCVSSGYVKGEHFTGGIAGENMGDIERCTNEANVNTEEQDTSKSLEDINLDGYLSLFSIAGMGDKDTDKESMANGIVDSGGIAGVSIGVIQHCNNTGTIGYERLGYNVGGIAGRQSGYINDCTNKGRIYGRKDVGGIVGQAEPYVTIDFSQDVVAQLSDNISKLHDIIAVTLQDSDKQSDAISNRLAVIQQFTDGALKDTAYLSDNTVTFVDGAINEVNKAVSRVDYIIDEAAKDGGILDSAYAASSNIGDVGERLLKTIEDIDVTQYLDEDQKKKLEQDLSTSKDVQSDYKKMVENMTKAYEHYYRDMLRSDPECKKTEGAETVDELNMRPKIEGESEVRDTWEFKQLDAKDVYDRYKLVNGWVHYTPPAVPGEQPTITSYPENITSLQGRLDYEVEKDLASYQAAIAADAQKGANEMFKSKYGSYPEDYFGDPLLDAADIIYNASQSMGDKISVDGQVAVDEVKRLADNLRASVGKTKDTFKHLSGMDDIVFPKLGEEYRAHTTSLNNNLQGMSDNFGYLNSEMNASSDTMIGDLSAVNDQFNVIMMLYTDAIDGVLDRDYSNVIEDDSKLVAKTCVDATVEACTNYGIVEGSLDVSGIVGTMAIEYDYDLESDVTGIKEANMNTTYLTKCVVRGDDNRGIVTSQKSYAGGICGLQELGTILDCGSYSRVESVSGDYVGGIAGYSYSDIMETYSKAILSGRSYVGGIVGEGSDLSDCYAIPNIVEAVNYYGAIAGRVDDEGIVRNNFFVSDELAGIDRISYSKKAEPITYQQMMALDTLPSDFKKLKVTFILCDDDMDEELIIKEGTFDYGAELTDDLYPEVPVKDGFYSQWDSDDISSILSDMEVRAEYVRLITTLASDEGLKGGQSAVLVDGYFKTGDVFKADKIMESADDLPDKIEHWELEIPNDGGLVHQVRYQVGDKYRDEVGNDFEVYVYNNGSWDKATTGKMGQYTTFDVEGYTPKFQVVSTHKDIPWVYIIAACVSVIIVIIVLVLLLTAKKRKARKLKKAKEKLEKQMAQKH